MQKLHGSLGPTYLIQVDESNKRFNAKQFLIIAFSVIFLLQALKLAPLVFSFK